MNNQRIEYLDSLRGIAAMSVVIFHCMISFVIFYTANYQSEYPNAFIRFLTESPLKILWSGKEPVLLFFVLSGFVLSFSFLKRKVNYKSFVMKRFSRIYIPYIVVMGISVICLYIFMDFKTIEGMSKVFERRWDHDVSLKALMAYIFMLNYDTANVNGVVWTLYHEMRISLLFPTIMLIVVKYDALKSFCIAGSIMIFSWLILNFVSESIPGFIKTISLDFRDTSYYALYFLVGAILCKYRNQVVNYFESKGNFYRKISLIIAVLLLNTRFITRFFTNEIGYVNEALAGIGIVLIISLALSSKTLQRMLLSKPLMFLGKISYSLYLVHVIVLMVLAITLHDLIGIVVAISLTPILSIPVAWLVYKYVEEPTILLGKKFAK